jgi:hypothetical protein
VAGAALSHDRGSDSQCDLPSEFLMIALARSSDPPDSEGDADPSRWGDVRLSSLLAATADRYPSRLAFADQPNRENWSARPRIAWTYANTQRIT